MKKLLIATTLCTCIGVSAALAQQLDPQTQAQMLNLQSQLKQMQDDQYERDFQAKRRHQELMDQLERDRVFNSMRED